MTLWNHQQRGINDILDAIDAGHKRICVTSPTGGGKTRMICELIDVWLGRGLRSSIYTNRKMLVEQASRVLTSHGLEHGIRAAGYEHDHELPVQISSIQTEASRVLKRKTWDLHDAQRVVVDEAHLHNNRTAIELLNQHLANGAVIVGFTATPLELGGIYDHLIVAGTNSELRECGALVRCHHYGPDEPDLKHIGKVPLGQDLSEAQNRKAIMVNGVFGRVFKWWKQLNPDAKPTILFAPGVAESVWFAEQFHANGVSAAHIDGEEVWWNGQTHRTSREIRQEVLDASRAGDCPVICNRFVLREGIDAPWLAHGIFATVFGSLQSYLQSGGRLLRFFPGQNSVTLQDHGGNWWRHGSLNADREWNLFYTSGIISGLREDKFREKKEREPVRCPKCGLIILSMACSCGFELKVSKKSRPVVQADGALKEMHGDIFKVRRVTQKPDGEKIWERMYWRSRTEKGDKTFRAAAALFATENNWGWPDHHWCLMPTDPLDWYRKVKDVPMEKLTRVPKTCEKVG